jgi:hypothetical protein
LRWRSFTAAANDFYQRITGSWSPALNNLVSTVYTFTPNSGQCAVNATLGITVNDPIIPLFDAATIPVLFAEANRLRRYRLFLRMVFREPGHLR